jgi:hypothetical protein
MRRISIVVAALVLLLLGEMEARAVEPYSSPTVRVASGDLAAHINSFVTAIPKSASEGYDTPTNSEKRDMARAYNAIEAGKLSRAAFIVNHLKYDVVRYKDTITSRTLILLSERQNQDGSWPHAWGMYVFSPKAISDATVEVAHPVADWNTEDVGVETFREANAEDLFIAGAHRYANSNGSADVAHAQTSVFEGIHEAAIEPPTSVFQPHGFSQTEHPNCGEAVVSAGTAAPTQLAQEVHSALRNAGFDARLYDGVECSPLGATTNVQGKSTRAIGAHFLHVETIRSIRDDAVRRLLLSRTIAGKIR